MTTTIGNKRIYIEPVIETILLDYEISLSLESEEPPVLPNESYLNAPHYFNNDPFNQG